MDAIQTYYLRNLGIVVDLANPKIVEIPFLFHRYGKSKLIWTLGIYWKLIWV